MYKLLIVDDEPIVLSGIKFLIDWAANDVDLIGTARSGQKALEFIDECLPDIVICDINMPGMSGLELLKSVSGRPYAPVFIMLTNHSEFELARESLRYKATDYLLKNQLEPETLVAALEKAKPECDKRKLFLSETAADRVEGENLKRMIGNSICSLLKKNGEKNGGEITAVLAELGVLRQYRLIALELDYATLPNADQFSREDLRKIYESERELLSTLLPKVFHDFALFSPNNKEHGFMIFAWGQPTEPARLQQLFSKIVSSSANLSRARLGMLVSAQLDGRDALQGALDQIRSLYDCYYRLGSGYLCYETTEPVKTAPLKIQSLSNHFAMDLRSKNIAQCRDTMDKIMAEFEQTPHTCADAVKNCSELFGLAAALVQPALSEPGGGGYFGHVSQSLSDIYRLINYQQVQLWLADFTRQVLDLLQEQAGPKHGPAEQAKEYICRNIDKRIMLQDVANYISISPSYLSALFKKQCNQTLVDYINQQKMERACELIREGKYRIYEISDMLGFENAYYFTKVFKRHTGLAPKEYEYKIRGKK